MNAAPQSAELPDARGPAQAGGATASASGPAAPPSAGPGGHAERLCAWFDGELDDEGAAPLTAELLRDPALQAQYRRWCLVSDALRSSEVLAGHAPRLCTRISQALQDEPALLAPRALPLRSFVRRHVVSGVAVAAAAAVLVFVAVPQLRGNLGDAGQPLTAAAPGAGALASVQAGARAPVSPRLEPYLRAHRDLSGAGIMPAAGVSLRYGPLEGERR